MATKNVTNTNHKHPDSLMTDRGMVRVSAMKPDSFITIHGRKVRAGDIPLCVYTLKCGHLGKGLAVTNGDLIFCEGCSDTIRVVDVKQ